MAIGLMFESAQRASHPLRFARIVVNSGFDEKCTDACKDNPARSMSKLAAMQDEASRANRHAAEPQLVSKSASINDVQLAYCHADDCSACGRYKPRPERLRHEQCR